MQHLLVETHKQNLELSAERFPHDVEIYSDMVSLETGIQKAINNLTDHNTLLWVKNSTGKITAKSQTKMMESQGKILMLLTQIKLQPQLQQINGGYWLLNVTSYGCQKYILRTAIYSPRCNKRSDDILAAIRKFRFIQPISIWRNVRSDRMVC